MGCGQCWGSTAWSVGPVLVGGGGGGGGAMFGFGEGETSVQTNIVSWSWGYHKTMATMRSPMACSITSTTGE